MFLCRFVPFGSDKPVIGVLEPKFKESVVALATMYQLEHGKENAILNSMESFLSAGRDDVFEASAMLADKAFRERPCKAWFSLETVRLVAPLHRPVSIRAAMTFEDHMINSIRKVGLGSFLGNIDYFFEKIVGRRASLAYQINRAFYKQPLYYKASVTSLSGPNEEIPLPSYAHKLDYEMEWACILFKPALNVKEKNARNHIAGYCLFNDFSVREQQLKDIKGRLGPAKGKDFLKSNALGPVIATKDELDAPYKLNMSIYLNGSHVSQASTSNMYWSFEEVIEYMSRDEWIVPGEVITSGCCPNGSGLENGRYLYPGDQIKICMDYIGSLQNKIVKSLSFSQPGF